MQQMLELVLLYNKRKLILYVRKKINFILKCYKIRHKISWHQISNLNVLKANFVDKNIYDI